MISYHLATEAAAARTTNRMISSAARHLAAVGLLAAATACGGPELDTEEAVSTPEVAATKSAAMPNAVVARLREREISSSQLLAFSRKLPETLKGGQTGIDLLRNHLQTLIDREILWVEAQKRGLEQSRSFRFRMRKVTKDRLVAIYNSRAVDMQIEPGEFEAFVEAEEFNRAIRFSEIIVDQRERAEELRRQIGAGASFEELAKKWSSNNNTAPNGGDRGRYTTKLEVDLAFRPTLFALEVGELSKPIAAAGGFWAIVKITDEMIVKPGPEMIQEIGQELQRRKFDLGRRALGARLAVEYNLVPNTEGVRAYVDKVASGTSFTEEDEDSIVLFTFADSGKITAGDLIELLKVQKMPINSVTTAERVLSLSTQMLVPDAMSFETALRSGIDKEPPVADWLEKQRRWHLIAELRASILEGKLDVSEEEAGQYFAENSAMFADPELLELEEILVETTEAAEGLRRQIDNGTSLGELAKSHSKRDLDHRDERGRVQFYAFEKALWGGLAEAAKEAETGVLTGPVEVEGGYSVFRVLSRGRKAVTFGKVKTRVVATVRWLRKQVLFEELVEELRPQYASEVVIDEAVLASLLEQE